MALGEHEWASVTVKRMVAGRRGYRRWERGPRRAPGEGVAAARKSQAETAQCECVFCVWAA